MADRQEKWQKGETNGSQVRQVAYRQEKWQKGEKSVRCLGQASVCAGFTFG